MADEKKKALEVAISQIEKSCGKGSIMRMDKASKLDLEVIPSGVLSLDIALGVGGFPKGRIVEISATTISSTIYITWEVNEKD